MDFVRRLKRLLNHWNFGLRDKVVFVLVVFLFINCYCTLWFSPCIRTELCISYCIMHQRVASCINILRYAFTGCVHVSRTAPCIPGCVVHLLTVAHASTSCLMYPWTASCIHALRLAFTGCAHDYTKLNPFGIHLMEQNNYWCKCCSLIYLRLISEFLIVCLLLQLA